MQNLDIDIKQLAEPPTKIGTVDSKPVIYAKTKGGYHLVFKNTPKGYQTLGVGNSKCMAMHIAEKRDPDVQWSELSKSEAVDMTSYKYIIPEYEKLTDAANKLGY